MTCVLLNFEVPVEFLLHQNALIMHQIVSVVCILYVHSDILLISILAFTAPLSIMTGHPFYPRF